MKISNVVEIFDNDEFITLVTKSGSSIHLPINSQHSITIQEMPNPADSYLINVNVDLYND